MIIKSYSRWKILSNGIYIDDLIVAKRRQYRYTAVWGLLFIIASVRFLLFHYLWQIHLFPNSIAMLLTAIALGYSRCFIEPYYSASIAKSIEHLCLYLRPFNTDNQSFLNQHSGFVTGVTGIPLKTERILCKELNRKIIQTFAIGNPNSNIPTTFSTSNIYANDSEWKDTIIELARKACVIVVKVGESEGCQWEINHCITNEYLRKTLFIVNEQQSLTILQEKISNINPITHTIDNSPKNMALFIDEVTNEWNVVPLDTKSDVKNCIEEYIKKHPSLNSLIDKQKQRLGVRNILKTKDVPAKWWQIFAFGTNIWAYCFLNKWPKRWVVALTGYFIFIFVFIIFGFLYILEDMDTVSLIIMFITISLLLIPWMWIAPKISWSSRVWPSREIFAQNNKSLFLWLCAFFICTLVYCLPFLAIRAILSI